MGGSQVIIFMIINISIIVLLFLSDKKGGVKEKNDPEEFDETKEQTEWDMGDDKRSRKRQKKERGKFF